MLETAPLKEIFEHEDTIEAREFATYGLVERIEALPISPQAADRPRTMIYRR